MLFLSLYVFFTYNAQNTLLPTVLHSVAMYGMILTTLIYYGSRKLLKVSIFTLWYTSFLFVSLLSAFSQNSDEGMIYTIFVSLVISYCFIQIIRSHNQIDSTANVYIISAIIMGIQIWASGQLNMLFVESEIESARLGTDIAGNANTFSALFMYAGVFAGWSMVFATKKRKSLIYLIALAIILTIMVISGGRKTIIAVVLTLALCFLLKNQTHSISKKMKYLMGSIASIVIVFYLIFTIPFLYQFIGQRFEGLLGLMEGHGASVSGDQMRSKMIGMAFNGWLDSPFWGHGIDSFKFFNQRQTGHFYYSHNNYLELLYDLGLIGFIVYYWIYYYIYKNLKRLNFKLRKYQVLGYALLIELLIFDFGGVSYYLVGNILLLTIAYICATLKITDR